MERASIRILSRRYCVDKRSILKQIHSRSEGVKDGAWIAKKFAPKWTGILAVDGKVVRVYDKLSRHLSGKVSEQELSWLNKKVWLCGIDCETGDLPHYELSEEESKIDLSMYFKTLKEMGYPLRVLVSDGNTDILSAARFVFKKDFIFQLCTRHFTESLLRHAGASKDDPKIKLLILLIQRVIEAENLDEASRYLDALRRQKQDTKIEKYLIDLFKKHAPDLTAHLFHPELAIPHTSNDIENLFRQLNLRLKSIGRFQKWQYAREYLKSWALMRRFTKFTDCRGNRRQRNDRAPLEIAGVEIGGVEWEKL